MDEKMRKFMNLLQEMDLDVSDAQISKLVQEAREEALVEAKAILKETMVRSIVERALSQATGGRDVQASGRPMPVAEPVPAVPEASPVARAGSTSRVPGATEEEQIRREIETIRSKITENEQLLGQIKTTPGSSEKETTVEALHPAGCPDGNGCGIYVYAVAEHTDQQTENPFAGLPSIDGAHPIYVLPYQRLEVIVSQVSLAEFGEKELEAKLGDVGWLENKVRAHENVIEAIFAHRTLVPMRFCTIYYSEEHVHQMMAQQYESMATTLRRLEDKQEWGVKVYCDRETLIQRIGQVSDKVRAITVETERKSGGAAYFAQKRQQTIIAEEIERIGDECAQQSHDRLSTCAQSAIINPLQSPEISGRKEEMILNGAYLVAQTRSAAFRAVVEELKAEYGNLGFSYALTGPWPPYSFVREAEAADEPTGG